MAGDPDAELAAIESMVADWEHQGTERLARVREVTDRVAELTATERSPDGSVTVTVGANGLPTDIRLGESARDRPMSDVSASIMATLRQAQSRLPALMAEVAAEAGLAGDSVVAHLLATAAESFPAQEDGPEGPAGTPGTSGTADAPAESDEEYFGELHIFGDGDRD